MQTTLPPLTTDDIRNSVPQLPPLASVENTPAAELLSLARQLEAQEPDWITFFREVLGIEGLVRRLFPTAAELDAFQQTDAYRELQKMLHRLRAKKPAGDSGVECQRVITLRIPKSLHLSLLRDARDRGTSMNQLSINRLLRLDDAEVDESQAVNS